MACWPWVYAHAHQGQPLDEFPHLQRWLEAMGERAAVRRAIEILAGQRAVGQAHHGLDAGARSDRDGS
jgi:GST-like protein